MVKVCKLDGEGTIAGTRVNGEDAPIPAIRQLTPSTAGGRPKAAIPARAPGD
jgi:hypothetical protein